MVCEQEYMKITLPPINDIGYITDKLAYIHSI